jgi:hypothetical protein
MISTVQDETCVGFFARAGRASPLLRLVSATSLSQVRLVNQVNDTMQSKPSHFKHRATKAATERVRERSRGSVAFNRRDLITFYDHPRILAAPPKFFDAGSAAIQIAG